ncbi:DUF1800 domain-containing protein [Lysobacter firmicutimachus]|uniref:DUF1800 domain-containing protein n=1 Tax=Lysobacter firmicutimachus TaxID=1792846 RepID=A0AAU8MU07_9GAMM
MSASKATAANRFGLGARPGELERSGDGREILLAQLARSPAHSEFQGLPSSAATMLLEHKQLAASREARAQRKSAAGAMSADAAPAMAAQAAGAEPAADSGRDGPADRRSAALRRELREQQSREYAARFSHAAHTDAPFVERLVQFWSNHFAVSVDKGDTRLYAASMEREAIRPHVLGRFQDMLLAVETHPAMLRYLDNAISIGDDSAVAQRAAQLRRERRGLNENLAREILELHTLGVDGGYRQDDVIELARAITGWSALNSNEAQDYGDRAPDSGFVFRARTHEPGARRVLGRDYAEGGVEQGRAVLADLARHPSTARHLSFKLARHFVADQPPKALVERMAQAYLREAGDLRAMYRAMVESDAAWSADACKFKTPNDFVISALRAGELTVDARALTGLLSRLGQPVFTPRSPAGFADTAADWSSPDGLWKRIQAAQMLAARVDGRGAAPYPRALAVLGESAVQGDFAIGLRRAGSASEGHALLFASPAFQWRA